VSWRRPARLGPDATELLDEGAGTPAEEAEAYRLLEQVNVRLGGHEATRRALALAPPTKGGLLLDVAGGDGAFAERLVAWSRAAGVPARAITLDLNPGALATARARPHVLALRADALRLPMSDRSVECAHCAAFFHHLGVEEARAALVEMCRVSRHLVVVNDLVRSWLATGAIWTLSRLLTENRLVRFDGPLSVRKSFVPGELLGLAHAAAAGGTEAAAFRWRVFRVFPYRMALVGVRSP
jgi:hypothetical protein